MGQFFNFLDYTLSKRYFFAINTCEDIEFFFKGCYIADTIYNQNNRELNLFTSFNEYVKKYYDVRGSQTWGKIIDFYSENNEGAFLNFRKMVEGFREYSKSEKNNNSTYLNDLRSALAGITNFSQFMDFFYEKYSLLGVFNIDNFDKFFCGYFTYGDYDKGTALFAPLKDVTFLDLHKPRNEFLKFLVREYKITPVNSYTAIIRYMSGPDINQSIETFISHFKIFYPRFLRNKSFPSSP